MGRSADVVDVRNVGAVIDARLKRTPEEELVERASAAIRIAADEIDVHRLEVRRRIGPPRELDLGPVLDMGGEPPLDAVRVRLAHCLRPATIRGRFDLAGRVALHEARRLRHLEPKDRRTRRRSAWIKRSWLAYADRGLGRQEAAFGFVRGARNAVQSAGQMDERDLGEIRIAAPAWRTRQGVMNLHVAFAVPKGSQASLYLSRRRHGPILEQA